LFNEKTIPTVGAGYTEKLVFLHNKEHLVHLWDTAGEERYRSMTRIYSRSAKAALVVFDVSRQTTLDAVPSCIECLESDQVPFVLVGNKSDLAERVLTREDGENAAAKLGVEYFETSAATGYGVDEAFQALMELGLSKAEGKTTHADKVSLENTMTKEEGGCGC
jgi:Ras-related protein Rab-8A